MIWHILAFTPHTGKKVGVIVEREGVIVQHVPDQGVALTRSELVPGAAEALAKLSRRGRRVVVIGDRRTDERVGLTSQRSRAIDAGIASEVEHRGGHIHTFVRCPHVGDRQCSCRYPRAGLLLDAARRSSLDLTKSVVISDRPQFLDAASVLGCGTILVHAEGDESDVGAYEYRAADLPSAIDTLLNLRSNQDRGAPAVVGATS
jgi:D-glycero-D-manno-heptose 1,7-bisphosphate phosphatase